jgi:hypothetical protein
MLEIKERRDRGEITWTRWADETGAIVRQASPSLAPVAEEYMAYRKVIAMRVDAKQMSPAEGEYELIRARNAVAAQIAQADAARRQQFAAAVGAIGQGISEIAERRAASQETVTNCQRDFSGIQCTTRRR